MPQNTLIVDEVGNLIVDEFDNNLSTADISLVTLNTPNLVITENATIVRVLLSIDATLDTLATAANSVELNLAEGILASNPFLTLIENDAVVKEDKLLTTSVDSIVVATHDASVEISSVLNINIAASYASLSTTAYPIDLGQTTDITTIPPAVLNLVERSTAVFYKETPYISTEVQKLSAGSLVTFYELDLTALGDSIYYFHSGTNELQNDVVWGGVTYLAFPIEASGFDISSSGEVPRPRLLVSNILGTIGALVRDLDDLVGAKVTRRRTFLKYIDAINFKNGNQIADPNVEMEPNIYYIDRKATETSSFVEFELSSNWDVQGIKLPRRQIIQNMCYWKYRSSECGYAGGAVADKNDSATLDIDLDFCSKSLTGCTMRFGENAKLPFGGFPGAGLLDV